jgi:hypothetical protein
VRRGGLTPPLRTPIPHVPTGVEDDWPHDRRAATRAPEDRAAARRRRRAEAWAEAAGAGWKVWLVKIVCLGVIDAMAIYAILVLLTKDSVVIAVVALGILAINVVYLKPGLLPRST